MSFPSKTLDPDGKGLYTIDWTNWLDDRSDTIASAVWTVPAAITLISQSESTTQTTITIDGNSATAGTVHEVSVHIVTAAGLEDDFTFELAIVEH